MRGRPPAWPTCATPAEATRRRSSSVAEPEHGGRRNTTGRPGLLQLPKPDKGATRHGPSGSTAGGEGRRRPRAREGARPGMAHPDPSVGRPAAGRTQELEHGQTWPIRIHRRGGLPSAVRKSQSMHEQTWPIRIRRQGGLGGGPVGEGSVVRRLGRQRCQIRSPARRISTRPLPGKRERGRQCFEREQRSGECGERDPCSGLSSTVPGRRRGYVPPAPSSTTRVG